MAVVELETWIAAPPALCYRLKLDVELHLDSTRQTGERVVTGPRSGQLALGDVVTWEARHLGVRQRLTVEITAAEPPWHFRDEMRRGAFRALRHDHYFAAQNGGTRMRDVLAFRSPGGVLGRAFDRLFLAGYLRRFLQARNAVLKQRAEAWAAENP